MHIREREGCEGMVYIHRYSLILRLDLNVFFSPMNNQPIKHMCILEREDCEVWWLHNGYTQLSELGGQVWVLGFHLICS